MTTETAAKRRLQTVAVVGGTGKTGRAVCQALAARGAAPLPMGRTQADGDLAAALRGVAALCLIAPNMHPDEPGFVTRILDAARNAGVDRIVYHSVAAPGAISMPHHEAKLRSEEILRRSSMNWTIVQPCAYMDNFLPGLTGEAPALSVPYSVDTPFGFIALADVGQVAARVLLDDGHTGATYELGGPQLLSVADFARAASAVAGVQVPAVRTDIDAWRVGPGSQLAPRERDWLSAMFDYYDRYGLPAGGQVTRMLLEREPADAAAFARAHMRRFRRT